MSLTKRDIPQDFEDGNATLGTREQRRIGKTAILFRNLDSSGLHIALSLHGTVIARWYQNGDMVIKHGGFVTVTTASWLNRALPPGFRVNRHRGDMILSKWQTRPDSEREREWQLVMGREVLISFANGSARHVA